MRSEILHKLAAVAESLDAKGYFDESNVVDSIIQKMSKLDPVGEEDEDIDNDGKKNTKKDKYLSNRRKAVGKAIKSKKNKKSTGKK